MTGVLAAGLGCLGYGSVFLAVGLYIRNPIVPAAVLLAWEGSSGILPQVLQKVSILYYLQSLCPVPAPIDADAPALVRLLPVRAPIRGDVVLARSPDDGRSKLIKRCVALSGDRIGPGTVIVFNEYFNYPGWQTHEFKAFQEFIAERSLSYRYLCFNKNECNVAAIIA